MRILIEGYQYDVIKVKDILYGIDALENVEGRVSIHYVGYYYNTLLKDCVFILPKVLLKDVDGKELAFGKYEAEDIVSPEQNKDMDVRDKDFLYKFSVWIYRAIVVYKNDKWNDTDIVYHIKIAQVGKGSRRLSNTYLDILLQLLQFNRDNQSFFFFILKNIHSGYNKINWIRTISQEKAIIQSGQPVYLKLVNKKKQVNFDEELLVIFFSILNYICDTYGFAREIKCQFQLIKGAQFQMYLKGYGRTRLRQIKYKYFSDKALELWNLCYAFFDEARQVAVCTEKKEYLLVKSFHIVFEAIIDELIGDNPLPDGMDKKQEDGKIVDHLYTAKSLLESEASQTYYIGDSKYYKMGHELGKESIYKQYTYARNVIQWNLDIFNGENNGVHTSNVKLRDNVTEGYNIIPNFFISAKMDENLDYSKDGIEKTDREKQRHRQVQFKNRLFDRDTLLLFHYDVNFLYVLSLYARNNTLQKAEWKQKMRNRFRKEIQTWLQEDYDFYAMTAHPNVNARTYIKEHFQEVLGKIYTPFDNKEYFSLALDKKDPEANNEQLLTELKKHFFVEKCDMGTDPTEPLEARKQKEGGAYLYGGESGQKCLLFNLLGEQYTNCEDKLRADGRFGVAIQSEEGHNVLHIEEGLASIAYLIVTNKRETKTFFIKEKPLFLSGAECQSILNTKNGALVYLVFKVDIPHEAERNVFSNMMDMDKVRAVFGAGHGIRMLDIRNIMKDESLKGG